MQERGAMKYTMLHLSIFVMVFCLTSASSSSVAKSVNGSNAETRGALCMACKNGCIKYGVSNVNEVLVIPGLDLDAEVAATIANIQTGNEAAIQSTITRTGPVFFTIGAVSISKSLVQAAKIIADALNNIAGAVNNLADAVNDLITVLELSLIYAQYMPDREAIQYQMDKLLIFLKSNPDNYCDNLREFMSAYITSGKDLPLHNMYSEASLILSQVSTVTGDFRRVVVDFGDDIIMHVNAGVAAYYVYNHFASLSTDTILDTWSTRLLQLQTYVSDAEAKCMSRSSQDDLSNYMYKIRDNGGCPYGNHEERCRSTHIAMTDKFDWMSWSFTCYDSPHGAHAYDEDEISGPQYARSGWDESQLRGLYMTKYQRDATDDNLVWNCMSGRKNLNCDDVHGILRGCGAGGSLQCAEVQLNVYNYRAGNLGFHEYIGGNDIDVWVTWINTAPVTKATAQDAADVPKMAAHKTKITEDTKIPIIHVPKISIQECLANITLTKK